jgi:cation-transporting P-type ATPase E
MRGLSQSEVAERLARGQSNETKAVTSRPLSHIIRDNVLTLFNGILTACFIVIVVIGDLRDGLFYAIVVANALIGIVQEVRAKVALDRLAVLASPTVAVRRDDATVTMHPDEIVLDDIVVLRAGDQIVADARVIESNDVTINESLITGEAEPVSKQTDDQILSGSLVATGSGLAIVTAVGAASYANRLTAEIRRHSLAVSELRAATNRILVYISWIIGPVVLVVVASRVVVYGDGLDFSALTADQWRDAALDLVASIVGFIPEGLVLLISLAYGVAAIRLARDRVLIQELAAVEILARVDVLCLDKTGTLTTGDVTFIRADVVAEDPLMPVVLANFAHDDAANATAHALSVPFPDFSGEVLARIPFASKRACSALTLDLDGTSSTWLLGAPERLLSGHPELLAEAATSANAGHRTLALVRVAGKLPSADEFSPESLETSPVAILVFGEQVRPDAAATLSFFAKQNVRCIIMSGDNPTTVAALAVDLGVGSSSVDARTLVDDAHIREALGASSIFGRVTPEQKRAMVRVLKEDGHTVAMTGDGVNDAMAIKDADLGIAMGSGTSASKAVARLVLLDNRFERLPKVLGLGRQVIANVERAANLFLTKTVYGILFAVVFAVLLWEFPFLPRQLTLVSTLTIGIPAFVLALASNSRLYHPGILDRLVRYAAPTGIIAATTTFIAYAVLRSTVPIPEAGSIATVTLFIVTFWILCVLARPIDRWRGLLLGSMIALFGLVYIAPFGQDFFAVSVTVGAPLGFGIAVGIVGSVAIEGAYRIARRREWIFDRV